MNDTNEVHDPVVVQLLAEFEKAFAPFLEWFKAASDLVQESDRSCVLMVCAIFDDLLERLLRTKFKVTGNPPKSTVDSLLTNAMAPIGSFAVRTKLAYSLGMIGPETVMVLDSMRSLRNQFAHRWRSARMTMEHLDGIYDRLSSGARDTISQGREAIDKITDALKQKKPEHFAEADAKALEIRLRFLALSLVMFFGLLETVRSLDSSFVRDEFDEFMDLCNRMKAHTPNWEKPAQGA